jgi:hypothetical protein
MLKAFALAALLAAPATTAPPLPPKPCISKAQVRDMVMVLSPYVVDAIAKRCGPALPATAFLNAGAPALSARLKAESAGREASAVAALKVFAGDKAPPGADQAILLAFMGQMMGTMAAAKLPVDKCAGISEILQSVSPLPAENFGQLFATVAQMADVGKDGKSPGICAGG